MATSAILSKENTPNIQHTLFLNPFQNSSFKETTYKDILNLFQKLGSKIVVKPSKDSGGGKLVSLCKTQLEVISAVEAIFQTGADVAIW